MSQFRVRRAVPALALTLSLLGAGCGESTPRGPSGITLPTVVRLDPEPPRSDTIVFDVTADGRISTRGREIPFGLIALRNELQRRTADPEMWEPQRGPDWILLIRADANLPWTIAQWIVQVAYEPTIGIYRICFGARARPVGSWAWSGGRFAGAARSRPTGAIHRVSSAFTSVPTPGCRPGPRTCWDPFATRRAGDPWTRSPW